MLTPRSAFSGSLTDTSLLILIPLFLTARVVSWTNTRGWAVFGATYSSWFMLIHSEVEQPLDFIFQKLWLGTPADHAIHHCLVKYNFAHFFPIFDKIYGTYRDPRTVFSPQSKETMYDDGTEASTAKSPAKGKRSKAE